MSYLRDEPEADMEFEASSGSEDDAPALEQFRLENIKDRPPIFDADALHDVFEDLAWETPADWTQTQVVTLPTHTEVDDVHDDMARELAFYHQGAAAAHAAIQHFEEASASWRRPPDYYAESVKSDGHMSKVKEQLMYEQKLIEEAEQRRKQRENKQYSKQVQAEKQKERIRSKKEQINDITKLRKQRVKSGFQGELEFDKDMKQKHKVTPDKAGQRIRQGRDSTGMKRQVKNSKFGFGGRKKLGKQNSAASTADMGGDRRSSGGGKGGGDRGKGGDSGKGGGKGKRAGLGATGGVGKSKRPGKDARAAKRAR